MLSAAAAALLTAAMAVAAARADTEISAASSTALATSTSGNIVIDSAGTVAVTQASAPAVTLNSNNSVINNGSISNANTDGGVGVVIDTTAGDLLSSGFTSTGAINVGGTGTSKRGIVIQGGHTFYGPITLTNLNALSLTGAVSVAQSSALIVQGDGSAAFLLGQGTSVTSYILLGGGGISQTASVNSTASGSIMVDLDGTLNGNFINVGGLSGAGTGLIGIQTLGGIHSCASDAGIPAGFTCPTSSSGGSFINAGPISLIGSQTFNTRGGNPEAGSAIVIGGNIDGGFLNTGPGTSNNAGQAQISSSGLNAPGVLQPVVLIDPARSITSNLTAPRGPVVIGPVTADVDPIETLQAMLHG